MSKRDYIIRYLFILKKLRSSRVATFIEINDYLQYEFELLDSPRKISLRTFQRDLNDIRTIFNIDIRCNNFNQYFIYEDEQSGFNNRMIESFDIITALSIGKQLTPYIMLEQRSSLGTEYIFGFLHAIKNKLVIRMLYQKFSEDTPSLREIEPYLLKEFKGRWYVLSKDRNDKYVKTFALDRIKEVDITTQKFVKPQDFNPSDYYKDCFGVISPDEASPVEIILSFDPYQGKYIKTNPLHESQKIIIDNDTELRVSLFLYITHDLVMELLSFGADINVLEPESLVSIMTNTTQEMNNLYTSNLT
jgi:predicted DNA-binding transcriptional regulator YafY